MEQKLDAKYPKENYIYGEIWKDVDGFEGLYQVSNLGRVRSLDRVVERIDGKLVKLRGVVLSPSINNAGYLRVSLLREGIVYSKQIHTIVAETFLTKVDDFDVDHINFNKLDNRVENLRYISHIDNVRRSVYYRTNYDKSLGHNPNAKTIIGVKGGVIVERFDCGKELCFLFGMNYSTFKYKMQRGGITFNNIHYTYGDKSSENRIKG